MIILRTDELVPCVCGEITVWISPLTWGEKTSLYRFTEQRSGETVTDESGMLLEAIRLSVKRVEGFEGKHTFSDGTPVALKLEDGRLTPDSVQLLVQVLGTAPASRLSSSILTDTIAAGIEGFEIDFSRVDRQKKS